MSNLIDGVLTIGGIEINPNTTLKDIEDAFGKANADNYPFTARGFTGSKNIALPEFSYERGYARAFQDGDILNIIDSETGNVATKFEFNKKIGWVMTD
ncbi:hypothetical protein [Bacillus proteolyticus]|uniref:hypothetical protein n=1 Tax=Bacillus proteolyticus TaxID=2026192 RepID=UPI0030F48751